MQEAIYYLSFTIAAFIFNLALCVLVSAYGIADKNRNVTFRNFTYFVLVGNAITCLDTVFRRFPVVSVPFQVRLIFYLLSLFSNVMLTFFFALYSESYFKDRKKKHPFRVINKGILAVRCLLTVLCFFYKLPYINESRHSYAIPAIPRFILAYLAEIYFLLYATVILVIRGKELNRRARSTAVGALGVTIAVIIFEMNNSTGILFNYFLSTVGRKAIDNEYLTRCERRKPLQAPLDMQPVILCMDYYGNVRHILHRERNDTKDRISTQRRRDAEE